jgi:hypothetical protein
MASWGRPIIPRRYAGGSGCQSAAVTALPLVKPPQNDRLADAE